MNDIQEIKNKVQTLAKQRGLSIRELCKKIGMTESGFSYTIKNNTLKVETLFNIADVLGVSINYFFPDTAMRKAEDIEKKFAILFDDFEKRGKDIDVIKHRSTLIVYSLLSELVEKDKILSLMNTPNVNECFVYGLINKLNKNYELALEEYEKMDLTRESFNEHYSLNYIKEEFLQNLKKFRKETNKI